MSSRQLYFETGEAALVLYDILQFILCGVYQCFVIKEKLGAGAFGEVYKVESKEDGKIYAVKRSSQRFRGEWGQVSSIYNTAILRHLT